MISLHLQKEEGMVYHDEIAEDVSRLDGIALIEWAGSRNPVKCFLYCVWWNGYEEFNLEEFKIQLEENKDLIKYTKDCI